MRQNNEFSSTGGSFQGQWNYNNNKNINNYVSESNKDSMQFANHSALILNDHSRNSSETNSHTPSHSNAQLEKLKRELEKVKKHNSQSRSKSRNGVGFGQSSIKQVPQNLKNEIIQKYKTKPDALVMVEKTGQNQIMYQTQNQQGRGLSRSSSALILQQALQNNEKCVNTKVFARFRPLNKIEVELTKNDLGIDCCLYPDEKTVVLMPESTVFTMDSVFDPNASQSKIYELVGSETITDVMNGYNGTIFAYGQTGSGKTYSMFGDIYNRNLKGLIPRSIEHIFKTINSCDIDIEFILTCSMLEIYKENMHDLFCGQKVDLKIKESPTRGIYVEGLTQICVGTENELVTMLEMGEQARKVAATRINQYSSRSHTIFMLEIKQRYPNDTEKKGKLNLVDLAGSEKVGKTGAMGDILEEAKKINLSLSCLGNVIHSLTTNSDHIPYRDSKLTRILQESLGGNFKTSLLVTCSSHSSSLEETLSTLKFATRAKSIKNHFKMNIKNSPEALQRIIQQLKRDLMESRQEIDKLKKFQEISIPTEDAIHNIPSQYDSSALMNMNKAIFKKQENEIEPKGLSIQNEEESNLDSLQLNAVLQERVEVQSSEITDLKHALKEQEHTIKRQEAQIEKLKRENLQLQEKFSQVQQDKEGLHLRLQNSNVSSEQELSLRAKQIVSLQTALQKYEAMAKEFMRTKAEQIELNFSNAQQQIKQAPQSYDTGNDFLKSGENLTFKKNVGTILKDMKNSIFNQKLSKCRMQELTNKIEIQITNGMQERLEDSSNVKLLSYETLRIETLIQSLECSIGTLEIQESLNYQKQKILKNKFRHEMDTSANLQEILEKAKRTHEILRLRIDNLEEESAKYQDNLLGDGQSLSNERPRGKIIQMVSTHNGGIQRQSLQPLQSSKKNKVEPIEMLQDCIIDELAAWRQDAAVPQIIENIMQSIQTNGLRTTKSGNDKMKCLISEDKQQESLSSISQSILTNENKRLQDKILVLTSEMELASRKSDILEAELEKRGTEVREVNSMLKAARKQTDRLQKEEFSQLRKQLDESHKPIYQEILEFFKRQNQLLDPLDNKYPLSQQQQLQLATSTPALSLPSSSHSLQSSLQQQQPISAKKYSQNTSNNQKTQSSGNNASTQAFGNQNIKPISATSISTPTNVSNPSSNSNNPSSSNISNTPNNQKLSINNNTSNQPQAGYNQSTSNNNNTLNNQAVPSKNSTMSLGFRYDYSFLSDSTSKQQNKAGQANQPQKPTYSTKY